MPTIALSQIDVGGPCKISDAGTVLYFEDGVKLIPNPVWREIPSAVGGEHDDALVDLTWTIRGRPKAVWDSNYRGILLPTAFTNWSAAGARMCGASNHTVTIIGSDSNGFTFTRACLTKMPRLFLGVGESLYDEVEWTGYIGEGKALTDTDAYYQTNTTAWTQADYPTTHQEVVCTAAWGAVSGWTSLYAERGFSVEHELRTAPVRQGNITVDHRITSYRALCRFMPEQPTTAQLLTAFNLQGASGGVGIRRSANTAAFVITGSGISVTLASVGLNRGEFNFDNKLNRHGEFGMITAMTAPGTRLTLA